VVQGRGLLFSLFRLVPERIVLLIIFNRLVLERICFLIIFNRLVPNKICFLIIFNNLVPERIGVLIIFNRLVKRVGSYQDENFVNCKLVLVEEHKETCFVVFSCIGFPRKNPGLLSFMCCFYFYMHW
jgi:hypothetical protein